MSVSRSFRIFETLCYNATFAGKVPLFSRPKSALHLRDLLATSLTTSFSISVQIFSPSPRFCATSVCISWHQVGQFCSNSRVKPGSLMYFAIVSTPGVSASLPQTQTSLLVSRFCTELTQRSWAARMAPGQFLASKAHAFSHISLRRPDFPMHFFETSATQRAASGAAMVLITKHFDQHLGGVLQ